MVSSSRFRIVAVLLPLSLLLVAPDALEAEGGQGELQKARLPGPVVDGDYHDNGNPPPAKVELGRLLFFDKILSGNRNISCATCHHPLAATGDSLSLSVGEGGEGLATERDTGSGPDTIHERVPRNAPPVFNLGAKEFRRMFHDGRVEVDPTQPRGFRSPAGEDLPAGLDNVLAVQAMFPVTSTTEMAGQGSENEISLVAEVGDLPEVWERLAARLRSNPTYRFLFALAYPEIQAGEEITFVHVANAIAAFEAAIWRADNSAFDRYLRGDRNAMSKSAKKGMRLFYGAAKCGRCHRGVFQTDHRFHAIAMPQIGPGKGDGPSGLEDMGRHRVTGRDKHLYRFRTPSLRNVALTGPWGHDGAFGSLQAAVEHHLDPITSLYAYDGSEAVMPSRPDLDAIDFLLLEDAAAMEAIASACQLQPRPLTGKQIRSILAFLRALTDPASIDLSGDIPESVPSGLPVAD